MTLIDKHFEEAFTRPTVLVFLCLCVSYFWKTQLKARYGTPPGANARAGAGRSLVRCTQLELVVLPVKFDPFVLGAGRGLSCGGCRYNIMICIK